MQTLCGEVSSPQFEHLLNAGASNFQTLERLLSRLALDVFLFGTATIIPPVKHKFIFLSVYYVLSIKQRLLLQFLHGMDAEGVRFHHFLYGQ